MYKNSRPYNSALKPRARELRSNATRHENHLWYDYLREFRPRFTRQRIIGNYIIDFYCGKAKIAVEIDGSQHYDPKKITYDNIRTKYLTTLGVQILRFSNHDVDSNFKSVCEMIMETVKKHYIND